MSRCTRIGERARWRAKCQNATPRSVASDTTTLDLGSPSPRGAIIRSSLIKLREMSKDSAMLARRTMRTQIITSLVAVSSYPSLCVRVRVYVYGCVPFLSIFFSIQCVCVRMRAFFVSNVKYLHFLIVIGYYRERNSAICNF